MAAAPQMAVLIDFENVGDCAGVNAALRALRSEGCVVVARAYAAWGRAAAARDPLVRNGVELVETPQLSCGGKNAADIRLVIDAMELALTNARIDTFVVFSGDGDFTPLAQKLRGLGRHVRVVAASAPAAAVLALVCDEFRRCPAAMTAEAEPDVAELGRAFATLRKAVGCVAETHAPVLRVHLKPAMKQLDPTFDERALGLGSFTAFLELAERRNEISLSGVVGDLAVDLVRADGPLVPRRARPSLPAPNLGSA